MRAVSVEQQIGVCQQPACTQQPARLFQDLLLPRKFAQVMQSLYRDDRVDLSGPAHFGQLGGPVIGHEIGAPKRHYTAVAPLITVYFEPAPGIVCQVSRKIEAAIADAGKLPLKAFGQKACAAGQLNDPGRAPVAGADLGGDPVRRRRPLRPLAIESRFPAARLGVGTNLV